MRGRNYGPRASTQRKKGICELTWDRKKQERQGDGGPLRMMLALQPQVLHKGIPRSCHCTQQSSPAAAQRVGSPQVPTMLSFSFSLPLLEVS